MGKVGIQNIKLYGYHGYYKEESIIGGWFVYDVEVAFDLYAKQVDDSIRKVIDYEEIYKIVCAVNAERQHLLETLAYKIQYRLNEKFGQVETKIRVTKLSPPLGGNVGATFFEC